MQLCDFGCGSESQYRLKNGRPCCSKSLNSCPNMRKRNSESGKGKKHFYKDGHPRPMKGRKTWMSGKKLVDMPLEIQEAYARANKNKIGVPSGKCLDPEKEILRCQRVSDRMKVVGGGYRRGSGRGKKGWYFGYWCDSSWELAYVIYNLDHGINFSRNLEKFPYEFEGQVKSWLPDFKLEDGTFVEVKGYHTAQTAAKFLSFTRPIVILDKVGILPYLEYALSKYGGNYIQLYGGVAESGLKHPA